MLGPNGAGKTTTFYMIVGLIKPNDGRIFLENDEKQITELTGLPVYRRAQLGVGYLAQEASVFRRLSVEDNIRAVLEMTDFSKEYQRERVEALIEEFRLQKVRKTLAITDRTYLLYEGKILKTGTAEELAADPMVRKVYLGQHFELKKSHQLTQEMKNRKGQELQAQAASDTRPARGEQSVPAGTGAGNAPAEADEKPGTGAAPRKNG